MHILLVPLVGTGKVVAGKTPVDDSFRVHDSVDDVLRAAKGRWQSVDSAVHESGYMAIEVECSPDAVAEIVAACGAKVLYAPPEAKPDVVAEIVKRHAAIESVSAEASKLAPRDGVSVIRARKLAEDPKYYDEVAVEAADAKGVRQ